MPSKTAPSSSRETGVGADRPQLGYSDNGQRPVYRDDAKRTTKYCMNLDLDPKDGVVELCLRSIITSTSLLDRKNDRLVRMTEGFRLT